MATVQVRYIVDDIDAAIAFYTKVLDFKLEMHPAPPFAMLSRGDLRLVLSAPNPAAGGGQSMPDGTMPAPGGWNRFAIEVSDLDTTVDTLRKAGARFRNNIVTGVGGKQILLEDPCGNAIELFQPIRLRLGSRRPRLKSMLALNLLRGSRQDAPLLACCCTRRVVGLLPNIGQGTAAQNWPQQDRGQSLS